MSFAHSYSVCFKRLDFIVTQHRKWLSEFTLCPDMKGSHCLICILTDVQLIRKTLVLLNRQMIHLLPKLQGAWGQAVYVSIEPCLGDKQLLALGAISIWVVSVSILLQPSGDQGISIPKPAYGVHRINLIAGLQQAVFKIIWAPVNSHPSSQPLCSSGRDDACTSPLPNGFQRNLAIVYNICKTPL